MRINIIEGHCELGWRVGILAWDAENHSAVWDHLNAVIFAFIDHCVAIIRWDDSIEQLVHHFNLHVCVLEHVGTVDFLKFAITLTLPSVDVLVLFQFSFNHAISLLDHRTEANRWLSQCLLTC